MENPKLEDITPDRLLRVSEVCALLNCSRKHLRKWIDENDVPYISHGNGIKRFLIGDIRTMLERIRSKSAHPAHPPALRGATKAHGPVIGNTAVKPNRRATA